MKRLRIAALVVALLCLLAMGLVRPDLPRAQLVERYGGGASRFADIEGMRVHYRDEGSGPPLLLLHGTSSSLHTWDGWAQRLSPRRRVVRLDMPGFGLTGPAPDRDYRAARLARTAGALLDKLGIAQADVAGNSLGGRVAVALALDQPARVRKLVLLDAAGLSGQKAPPIFALAQIPGLGRILTVATPRALVRNNVAQVYGDASKITESVVDRYFELTRAEGNREALLDRLRNARDPDLDGRLGELKMPVLILWGERDRWIPPPFAERFHKGIPNSRLVMIAGAGHVPMEEMPEETAREVEKFLGE
jgi:pimeloyl-ACP methyl ester carboxylesterase